MRGNGPKPKISAARQRHQQRRAGNRHHRRNEGVAGAADDVGERVEQPDQDDAGEHDVGIGQRHGERAAAAAERRVEPRTGRDHRDGEERGEARGDDQRVQDGRVGILAAARAERARDRRRHAAAHRAGRHHLHQHDAGKHQRDAGERIGAELADEIGLDQAGRGLHQRGDDVGDRQPQQGRRDRRFDQDFGAGVHRHAQICLLEPRERPAEILAARTARDRRRPRRRR